MFLAFFSSYAIFNLVGIGPEGGGYYLFLINVFLLLYVAESFAEFICTFIQNLLVALCVYAAFFTVSFIAMGLLIPVSHLPEWWKPMHFASFHKYAIEVFMWNAFHGWKVTCDKRPKALCRLYRTGDDILIDRDISTEEEDIYKDLRSLVFLSLFYRCMSWLILTLKVWSNTWSLSPPAYVPLTAARRDVEEAPAVVLASGAARHNTGRGDHDGHRR